MKKIFSKINPEILLHTIFRYNDISEERVDISPAEEFLQVSTFELPLYKTFKPHKHNPCEKIVRIPQESWVILRGSVKVSYYDIDDSLIEEIVLNSGDLTITYRGGHTYTAISDEVRVYEFKVPQYTGQADDKTFIG